MESQHPQMQIPQSSLAKLLTTQKNQDLFPQIDHQTKLTSLSQNKNLIKYTELNKYIQRNNNSFNTKYFAVNRQKYKPYCYATTLTRNINKLPSPMPKTYHNIKYRSEELIKSKPKQQQLIPSLKQPQILQNYKIISHIGKGCFSIVSSAINKTTNTQYAIKTYTKIDKIDPTLLKNIQNQINVLSTLKHQNIIELYHAVKKKKNILLIMEYGGKQSLSRLLRKTNTFDQITAINYFQQIVNALAYCHRQNICHRDLKLQNILINESGKVKVIDFGFSLKCNNKERLTTPCGTPPYMSPELVSKSNYNGHKSDIWALGVILYLMLHGRFPFRSANEKQLYRLIQHGKYKLNDNLSYQAKYLLSSMLKLDENTRMTAQDILTCSWLQVNK